MLDLENMSNQEFIPQSKRYRRDNTLTDQDGMYGSVPRNLPMYHDVKFQEPTQRRRPVAIPENETAENMGPNPSLANITNTAFNHESDYKMLMNQSFIDVVSHICERTNEIDKIGDAFITTIIDILFNTANYLKNEKPKIDKIISVLVDIGLKQRESGNENKLKMDIFQLSHTNQEAAGGSKSNYEKKCLSSLLRAYELEKRIKELTEKKLEIFSEALTLAENEHTIILSDDDSFETEVTDSIDANTQQPPKQSHGFSLSAVNLAVRKIERNIKEEQPEMETTQVHQIKQETLADMPLDYSEKKIVVRALDDISQDTSNKLYAKKTLGSREGSSQNQIDKIISHQESFGSLNASNFHDMTDPQKSSMYVDALEMTNIVFESQKQNITSIKAFKKICIATFNDGSLHLFSIHTGVCLEVIKLHNAPITSLCMWQTSILTTSTDGQISSLVLPNKYKKSLNIPESISCAKELSGLLYVGTSVGNIYKINVRSLTQIRCPVQVSSTCILSIEVIRMNNSANIIVAPRGKPVTLRNPDNGNLICTFSNLDGCSLIGSLQCKPALICCLKQNAVSFISIKDSEGAQLMHEQMVSMMSCICSSGRLFFLGGEDGNIYIYNNEPVLICVIRGPGGAIRQISVHDKKVIICCQGRAILAVTLPPALITLMASKTV